MDSIGIPILGLRCSWWHSRQANDATGFEQSIFSENHDYKRFVCIAVNPYMYVPILRGIDVCGRRKLITHTQTHSQLNNEP